MERRARVKKPSKISVTHYPNLRVKPIVINIGDGDIELYPVYYYITIRRRTIHRVSLREIGVEKDEDISRYQDIEEEARMIKAICKMYLDDLDSNRVDKDIIEHINRKTKDRFVAELNAYIKYWTGSVATELWKLFHFEVRASINKKICSVLNWEGLNWEEKMSISVGWQARDYLRRADYIFLENNTEGEDRDLLYAWHLVEFLDEMNFFGGLRLTRYALENSIKVEEILKVIQVNREEIKKRFGSEKLANLTQEECTRLIELMRYWQKTEIFNKKDVTELIRLYDVEG